MRPYPDHHRDESPRASRVQDLERIAYLHRACAHVMLGWSPKVSDLETKRRLAVHAHADLERSQALERQLWAQSRADGGRAPAVRSGWRDAMVAIDASPTAAGVLYGIYARIKPWLSRACSEWIRRSDRVLDARLLGAVVECRRALQREIAWGEAALARCGETTDRAHDERIGSLLERAETGSPLPPGGGLWGPLDRAPNARRPSGMRTGLPGSMRPVPLDSGTDRGGIGLYLHNSVNGEYTTLELVSRCSYEHPDMPAAFHLDMARQAADEARHAEALEALAADYGVAYGDHPVYTLTYDGYYEFAPCEPGSRRELLWRLLLRATVDEGVSLDDLAFQIRRRRFYGQQRLANVYRYILGDELFHVQGGLKWTRYLCGGDAARAMAERELARAHVQASWEERRERFVTAHPEIAAAEADHLSRVAEHQRALRRLPFGRALNVQARREAGYTDAELRQVESWELGAKGA